MEILLVGINSRYTHTNLALRYIREALIANNINITFKEYTINNEIDYIIGDITYREYDYICFSVYIWNIETVEKICETIKKAYPDIKTIFGGPEVTYNSREYMKEFEYIDYIVKGEGEEILPKLIKYIEENKEIKNLEGITYKKNNKIIDNNGINKINYLEDVVFPYESEYNQTDKNKFFKNKYIYYETTRGCPYNCGFCLSSADTGIRSLSLDRIKKDLDKIYELNPLIIKFVDRTFNYNWKRSKAIMEYIINKDKNIKIHFEITADIINKEFLDYLKNVPNDIFQFEIGIQSTNKEALKSINRSMNFKVIKNVIKELNEKNNIHTHLDLIAGLPKENYKSFINSFNEVYKLNAEKLQLGFLKVLKGTDVYLNKEENEIIYRSFPPYEIIKTKHITDLEIKRLKKIDILLNKYYTEGYFSNTVNYIIGSFYSEPYDFYDDLVEYWDINNYFSQYHKRKKLYDIIYGFAKYNNYITEEFTKMFIFDFVINNKNLDVPRYIESIYENNLNKLKRSISRNEYFISKYFHKIHNKYNGKIINEFRILEINNDTYLFIYEENKCKTFKITSEINNIRKDENE